MEVIANDSDAPKMSRNQEKGLATTSAFGAPAPVSILEIIIIAEPAMIGLLLILQGLQKSK
jgi:hypothetical protein